MRWSGEQYARTQPSLLRLLAVSPLLVYLSVFRYSAANPRNIPIAGVNKGYVLILLGFKVAIVKPDCPWYAVTDVA